MSVDMKSSTLPLYVLQRAENAGQLDKTMLDMEIVNVRTELEQLRAKTEAERASMMAVIEDKDREIESELEEIVSIEFLLLFCYFSVV